VETNGFALGTLSAAGRSFPALVVGDRFLDLGDVAPSVLAVLQRWDTILPTLKNLAADKGEAWRALSAVTIEAPLIPGQIFQCGANYRTHVIDLAVSHRPADDPDAVRAEVGEMMDRRAASGTPYLFLGLPSAIAGPYDDLDLPPYSDQHDWELELAAVIGKPTFRVSPEEALEHVAGYTIVNDITTRDLVFRRDMPEIGTDWFRAKNAPGFLPTGPWVVPAEFVGDTGELQVTLLLNGKAMQDETTKDMIFGVAALVAAASQITRLNPGDLILTGSPAGNGAHWGRLLRDGDVMEGTITGLGTQRVRALSGGSDA
jgi:2-keto-4-pentenoate hydratase/2-oxohepta-3-ene-1,7-dioic acid hydratase in catechol pathway